MANNIFNVPYDEDERQTTGNRKTVVSRALFRGEEGPVGSVGLHERCSYGGDLREVI